MESIVIATPYIWKPSTLAERLFMKFHTGSSH